MATCSESVDYSATHALPVSLSLFLTLSLSAPIAIVPCYRPLPMLLFPAIVLGTAGLRPSGGGGLAATPPMGFNT